MKIGVRAHDFGRKNEKDLAADIKNAGFDCVQLALTKAIEGINSFDDITTDRVYSIKNEFDKNGVEITILGCYIEPSIKDEEQRQKNIATFIRSFEHTKILGTKIIGTETTSFSDQEIKRAEYYDILKDSVSQIIEKAEKSDIIMAIEPVAEHTLNDAVITRKLLDEINSENLKIIFDPVNLLLPNTAVYQKEIFEKFFELLGNEIVVMHAKDMPSDSKEWRNIGDGIIDYNFIFERLATLKPDLRILREGVESESMRIDLEYLNKLKEKYQA